MKFSKNIIIFFIVAVAYSIQYIKCVEYAEPQRLKDIVLTIMLYFIPFFIIFGIKIFKIVCNMFKLKKIWHTSSNVTEIIVNIYGSVYLLYCELIIFILIVLNPEPID